jgi:hypothetical protein
METAFRFPKDRSSESTYVAQQMGIERPEVKFTQLVLREPTELEDLVTVRIGDSTDDCCLENYGYVGHFIAV